jgi:polyphosphate glucokinase
MKKVLVIDVGGTNLKVALGHHKRRIKIPSGPEMTAAEMVAAVKQATTGWSYDVVSLGYPGPVREGQPTEEPRNLGHGWVGFDYQGAFGKPVRILNDAALQALGSYEGGRMLFLGLGTGLGSALVVEGVPLPLELAHLPYRNERTYEGYAGARGLKRLGRKRWARHVWKIVELLMDGLQADYVVLGGGNDKKLERLPPAARRGSNAHAILGGQRLWQEPARLRRLHRRGAPAERS